MIVKVLNQRAGGQSTEKRIREFLEDINITRFRMIVSFATLDGVNRLGAPTGQSLSEFLSRDRNKFECVIGANAITTPFALEEIVRLKQRFGSRVDAKAFSNHSVGLFHPKVYLFNTAERLTSVIVGSSNLTSGGLSKNIETNLVLTNLEQNIAAELDALWDEFWNHEDAEILNQDIIDRVRIRYKKELKSRLKLPRVEEEVAEDVTISETSSAERVLVRFIPLAGNRTSQMHFTKDIVEKFFGFHVTEPKTIKLQEVSPLGELSGIESRLLVYSTVNRNPKVEINGVKRLTTSDFVNNIHPILVMEAIGDLSYRYLILKVGEPGYDNLSRRLEMKPSIGNALKYWITDVRTLLHVWGEYPQ